MTDRRSASSPSTEGSSSTQDPLGSAAEVPNRLPSERTLERLDARRVASHRYRIDGEIGRGGMGAILRVWDEDLRRHLAMKVILGETPESGPGDSRRLARFLEEAQVTGQLDHPGIVPVHELGRDERGQVYFTMHLVKGMHFGEVIRRARQGQDGWNATRALLHLHRVAEALAFAHERRVLHRDIKPTNVMVGRHGETFVMDWGLARLLDAPESKSIQLAGEPAPTLIQSDRHSGAADDSLCTMDGDVVGTPAYMSPEQARGEIEHLGPATDIYSLGAVLYELLAGHAPYGTADGRHGSPRVVWRRVLDGPPAPLREVAPAAQPELVAIAERAMARNTADRYASMQELADDLRAYLEGRVVRAHAVGPVPELLKWISRNKSSATMAAAATVLVLLSGFLLAWRERERAREREIHLDRQGAANLVAEADDLWPLHPDTVAPLRDWLERVEYLATKYPFGTARDVSSLDRLPQESRLGSVAEHRLANEIRRNRAREESLRNWRSQHSLPRDPAQAAREEEVLAKESRRVSSETARLETHLGVAVARSRYGVGSEQLFVAQLGALFADHVGLRQDVQRRQQAAKLLQSQGERFAEDWRSVRGPHPSDSPYAGLELKPQLGLVPLGRNPHSGLLEFWVEVSGARPQRRSDGTYEVADDTGIVLVLIPSPPSAVEIPMVDGVDRVVLSEPYFLSRYELTMGQWLRMGGPMTNAYMPGWRSGEFPVIGLDHPAETVSPVLAETVLARAGLSLPSEIQWLWAAGAGTQEPFWFGEATAALGRDNLHGLEAAKHKYPGIALPFDDGWLIHGPVDLFEPNPFGLHLVHGNVAELCADPFFARLAHMERRFGPGQVPTGLVRYDRVVRGGGYSSDATSSHLQVRYPIHENTELPDVGIRPARNLENP